LQRLELATQRSRVAAQPLELARELHEALVLDDALDANQARLDIGHAQREGVLGRSQRAAPAREDRSRCG
jgi:hypothetical protein